LLFCWIFYNSVMSDETVEDVVEDRADDNETRHHD